MYDQLCTRPPSQNFQSRQDSQSSLLTFFGVMSKMATIQELYNNPPAQQRPVNQLPACGLVDKMLLSCLGNMLSQHVLDMLDMCLCMALFPA